MPNDDGFFGPVGYSVGWPLLGGGLLVLLLAWYGYVLLSTRALTNARIPGYQAPPTPLSVRDRYLAVIDAVMARYDAGQLTGRQAHQELSLAVRSFVHELTGVTTHRMTLAELRRAQLPALAEAVEQFYPAEFAVPAAGHPGQAAEAARQVVLRWN
ncbi:MAG: hypothetical protein JWO93_206 [Micrococcaceae bacterium]|nr:hypothetical protein [Micrococcaceae bacterium]